MTAAAKKGTDSLPVAAGAPPNPTTTAAVVTLETPFLYQNSRTGQSSCAPLSARQLCRILCPAGGTGSVSSIITPRTLVIGYDPTTRAYDPSGWRPAASVPLLGEACASWYYEGRGGTRGPVSARALADLLRGKDGRGSDVETLDDDSRVFPCRGDGGGRGKDEWTRIADSPYLRLAAEALAEAKSMPTSWPAAVGEASSAEKVAEMTYDDAENNGDGRDDATRQKVSDELEAFLSSTDHLAPHAAAAAGDGESEGEEYESDGGTRYVRDSRTGNWVHEALAPRRQERKGEKKGGGPSSGTKGGASVAADGMLPGTKKRKRSKPKFSARNARNWIYVTGLPGDTNEEEVAAYFSKVGILDLDPETQRPKVKLYREKVDAGGAGPGGAPKGDASICYARPESVELALQILDENLFRDGATLSVQRAKFEQRGDGAGGRRKVSEAKRKVARLAALQAVGWDEGENGRIAGGLKGLRMVVLTNMFDPRDLARDEDDAKLGGLEREVRAECEEIGAVEKITVFSGHPAGVMIVKFAQPNAASDAVNKFHGKVRGDGRKVEASYWDGVTDYTNRDAKKEEEEAEKRLDEFGDWLENQDLPEEFNLRVEE